MLLFLFLSHRFLVLRFRPFFPLHRFRPFLSLDHPRFAKSTSFVASTTFSYLYYLSPIVIALSECRSLYITLRRPPYHPTQHFLTITTALTL
jgi:hypothetical protein